MPNYWCCATRSRSCASNGREASPGLGRPGRARRLCRLAPDAVRGLIDGYRRAAESWTVVGRILEPHGQGENATSCAAVARGNDHQLRTPSARSLTRDVSLAFRAPPRGQLIVGRPGGGPVLGIGAAGVWHGLPLNVSVLRPSVRCANRCGSSCTRSAWPVTVGRRLGRGALTPVGRLTLAGVGKASESAGADALRLAVRDRRGRPLRDLRISVTDRCNFRCGYCMPRDVFGADHAFLPRSELLSYEELGRLVGVFADLGVSKIRLTGGEPLLRRDIEVLVSLVASTPGISDVALTTNGSLLAGHAQSLREAGLHRVTVSLDSLDPTVFAAMGDTNVPLSRVLDGITAAAEAGLTPVKLNTVLRRGMNEAGLLELVEFARDGGYVLRFIEYMDVGSTNGWDRSQVVASAEVLDRVAAVHPVEPVAAGRPGEVAQRWRYLDGRGELGLISSVSMPFCGTCTRARLTAIGELYTCLFAAHGSDLRALLRSGVGDEALHATIASVWGAREDRYSELRSLNTAHLPEARNVLPRRLIPHLTSARTRSRLRCIRPVAATTCWSLAICCRQPGDPHTFSFAALPAAMSSSTTVPTSPRWR